MAHSRRLTYTVPLSRRAREWSSWSAIGSAPGSRNYADVHTIPHALTSALLTFYSYHDTALCNVWRMAGECRRPLDCTLFETSALFLKISAPLMKPGTSERKGAFKNPVRGGVKHAQTILHSGPGSACAWCAVLGGAWPRCRARPRHTDTGQPNTKFYNSMVRTELLPHTRNQIDFYEPMTHKFVSFIN